VIPAPIRALANRLLWRSENRDDEYQQGAEILRAQAGAIIVLRSDLDDVRTERDHFKGIIETVAEYRCATYEESTCYEIHPVDWCFPCLARAALDEQPEPRAARALGLSGGMVP
jgi:hypothetical protein